MKIGDKTHLTVVFLIILDIIMMLALVVISLSNDAFAQSIHSQTLPEVIKQTSGLDETAHIDVGDSPIAIDVVEFNTNTNTHAVYVANSGSDSVSVIENTTKIKDIPVGDSPSDIAVNQVTDYVYVANSGSDSVSVIENTTKIKDIPVGDSPSDIGVVQHTNTAYVINSGSDSVSVISLLDDTKIKDIPVGVGPVAIGVSHVTDYVYVANSGSDSVSVIENTTKIKDIPVGDSPVAIGVGEFGTAVYVINWGSDSVSVISLLDDTKIKDIPVGDIPSDIGVDNFLYSVYVANGGSSSISVISLLNDTKIGEDIPVEGSPEDIGFKGGAVYLVNKFSDSVSVVDGTVNRVVAGVTFHANPFNSGYILCDGLTTPSPTEQYMYVYSGTECVAKPNEGFEFVSWAENLERNSTQLITVSRPASTLDSIAATFGFKLDEPEAKLNITKFGTYTANFKELPPAFPPEYWIPLYGIIASTIVGWSIPSIIGWTKSKRDAGKLNFYHKQISSLYGDGKLDENDVRALDQLRSNIVDAYSRGKLNEKHYENLKNETSVLYEKIFRKRFDDALNSNYKNPSNKKVIQEQLAQIRNEVKYAYSEGKINEKHYDLLDKDISKLDGKEDVNAS